jgi:hypothetical protein
MKTRKQKRYVKNPIKRKTSKVTYWRDMKPMPNQIKKYKKKYGSKCFLLPKENKYPICNKNTGKVECKGLQAGNYRAMLSIYRGLKPKTYSYRSVANKARSMAKRKKCNWAMTKKKNGGGNGRNSKNPKKIHEKKIQKILNKYKKEMEELDAEEDKVYKLYDDFNARTKRYDSRSHMKTKDTHREMNNDYNRIKKIDDVLLNSKKVLEEKKDRELTELRNSYEI